MDSHEIDRLLRQFAHPVLREAGFDTIRGRNAWRSAETSIAVVNFQSFNSYLAATLGCTTYSFAVNVGVYYRAIAPAASLPREPECHARMSLEKRIDQPKLRQPGIWYVTPKGRNAEACVKDAASALRRVGLPWISRFSDPRFALQQYLRRRTSRRIEHVAALGTLAAAEEGGRLARKLGDEVAERRLWQAVLDEPFYSQMKDIIAKAKYHLRRLQR